MKKKKRSFKCLIISLTIFVGMMGFPLTSNAQYIENVLLQWDHLTDVLSTPQYSWDTNKVYGNITFVHSYSYTQSSKNVTTLYEAIVEGISDYLYTRTYSTW